MVTCSSLLEEVQVVGKAIGEMVQVKGSEGCAGVEQVTSVLVKAIRLAEEPLRRRIQFSTFERFLT